MRAMKFSGVIFCLLVSIPAAQAQQPPITLGQQLCAQQASDHVLLEQRLLARIDELSAQIAKRKAEDEEAAKAKTGAP